jgi:hypothetical protein
MNWKRMPNKIYCYNIFYALYFIGGTGGGIICCVDGGGTGGGGTFDIDVGVGPEKKEN